MSGFSKDSIELLNKLNSELLSRFIYTTDKDQYGVSEYWEDHQRLVDVVEQGSVLVADCEAFAMAAMMMVGQHNYPVRLVFCRTETGEGHCICEVASNDKTEALYFDNRFIKPVTKDQLEGYQFLRVSPWNPQRGDQRPWLVVKQ